MDCTLTAALDIGNHMFFVGTIIASRGEGGTGHLLWCEYSYPAPEGGLSLQAETTEDDPFTV